jgi:hypothetical protein
VVRTVRGEREAASAARSKTTRRLMLDVMINNRLRWW